MSYCEGYNRFRKRIYLEERPQIVRKVKEVKPRVRIKTRHPLSFSIEECGLIPDVQVPKIFYSEYTHTRFIVPPAQKRVTGREIRRRSHARSKIDGISSSFRT